MKDNGNKLKMTGSYRDLIVWQRAVELTVAIYEMTENYPKDELFGLVSQMRRAAVSIPSNIAEGRRRGSKAEFLRFLAIAYASGAELETQIEIAVRLSRIKELDHRKSIVLLEETMKMLNKLLRS